MKSNDGRTPAGAVPLELLASAAAGEREAWSTLLEQLAPQVRRLARGNSKLKTRGLTKSEDDLHEVCTLTYERLRAGDFANLKHFVAQVHTNGEQAQSFDSWLYGLVDFAVRAHLRQRYGRAPKAPSVSPQPSKRDLGTFSGRLEPDDEVLAQTLGLTQRVAASEILDYVHASFDAEETRAMHLFYLEEKSYADVASELGLEDAAAAEKLVRRLNARLRHRFGEVG